MKYITGVETLEELKSVYKKLAMKLHPDRPNGSEEEMKILNNEYDELFEKLKNTHKNKDGEFYTKETDETSEYWKDIFTQLFSLNMEGVLIEVIGSFLWINGNTQPYKEKLKELKMKWSPKKKAWYLSPKGYRRYGKKNYEMDEIRGMYGSKTVNKKSNKRIA